MKIINNKTPVETYQELVENGSIPITLYDLLNRLNAQLHSTQPNSINYHCLQTAINKLVQFKWTLTGRIPNVNDDNDIKTTKCLSRENDPRKYTVYEVVHLAHGIVDGITPTEIFRELDENRNTIKPKTCMTELYVVPHDVPFNTVWFHNLAQIVQDP